MRLVLNVLWLVLCGFWMAIGYCIAGIICCILIITIPFGIASFRIANYALWPFGRTIERQPAAGVASTNGNVIWFVFAGLWLAIGHLLHRVRPLHDDHRHPARPRQAEEIDPISLTPLGYRIVDINLPGSGLVTDLAPRWPRARPWRKIRDALLAAYATVM